MPRLPIALLLLPWLGACALWPFGAPRGATVTPDPVRVVGVAKPAAVGGADQATIKALVRAESAVDDAARVWPAWREGRRLLDQAHAALDAGDVTSAALMAGQAERQARVVAAHQFRRRGIDMLRDAKGFAQLDDDEAGRLRAAELSLARGEDARGYDLLRPLVFHLHTATHHHVVQAGETLWSIAARPEVYDNELLWPLLFGDNRGLIRVPETLRQGWRLRVRKHPRLDAVFDAVVHARARRALSDPSALDGRYLEAYRNRR